MDAIASVDAEFAICCRFPPDAPNTLVALTVGAIYEAHEVYGPDGSIRLHVYTLDTAIEYNLTVGY